MCIERQAGNEVSSQWRQVCDFAPRPRLMRAVLPARMNRARVKRKTREGRPMRVPYPAPVTNHDSFSLSEFFEQCATQRSTVSTKSLWTKKLSTLLRKWSMPR